MLGKLIAFGLLTISLLFISKALSKFLEYGGEVGSSILEIVFAVYAILFSLLLLMIVLERYRGDGEEELGAVFD